jgi:photosystem II stability/assembly factor-like uncharacterized protein
MKAILTRTKWVLFLSPILAAVLLIFGYHAIARRADNPEAGTAVGVSPAAPIPDADEEQSEYFKRFYGTGPGQVSHADFAASLATARALPPSPLLRDKSVVSGSEGSQQDWTYPVPPPLFNFYGGGASVRTDAIAVHPGNANTVYVGSEGGLAKSTDGGDNWSYLSDGLLSQSIRSIAIDPNAPNIVYVGTGTGQGFGVGIYRSTDSGATWSLISGPIVSSPFSASGVVKIVVDPNTAGSTTTTTVYASVVKAGVHSFWRSTNSGSNWTSFRSAGGAGGEPFCFYDIAINPDAPTQVYITAPDGVFRRDAWGRGSYWVQIHAQLPSTGDPSCLAFASTNPSVPSAKLYLAYQDGGNVRVIKSGSPPDAVWEDVGSTGGNIYCFGVDPAHPNRIFVGGAGSLRYSMNGGTTWLDSGGGVHIDIHSIAFCPSNQVRHYLGTDGGIYRADYMGNDPDPITWDNKNQTLAGILTQGVSISRDDRILIGTQDNANQLSRPASRPWAVVYPCCNLQGNPFLGGDGVRGFVEFQNNVEKIYAITSTGGVVGLDNGIPVRIIDGTPTSITPPGAVGEYSANWPALYVKFKAPANTDRVFMGFQHVWRSIDSGNSWTRIGGTPCPTPNSSSNCGIDPTAIVNVIYEAPSNSNYIYAITGYGARVFMTSNANEGPDADWVNITHNLPGGINAIAVHPNDPLTVYLTGGSKVYKTINGGGLWVSEDVGPDFIFRDVAFHPADPSQIFVASHRGVYARVNGVWGSMNANLPAGMAVVNLSFNEFSHQLAASTYGRGVYVLDLDREPPTVSLTPPPANGATISGTVVLSAIADDNHRVAGVQFKINGANLDAEDTTAPYSITWNTSLWSGSHTLTATARDPYGNTTTSAPVTVTIDNTAPTVSIIEPDDGKKVAGFVTVSATASDNEGVAGVQFILDGNELDDEDTSAPFSINWDTTLMDNGEHRLRARARDAAGNITTSEAVTVVVAN